MSGVIVTASIIICDFAAFSTYMVSVQRVSMEKSIESNIMVPGQQASRSIANWMNGSAALASMSASLLSGAQDEAAIKDVLHNGVLADNFSITYYGTEATGNIYNSKPVSLPSGYDPRKRPWTRPSCRPAGWP